MEPMYSLTMIGIIATILSVAFGLAALINSSRHRKHLLEEKRSRQEADDEGGQQGLSDDNLPSGRAEAGADARTHAIFKQFGPPGKAAAPAEQYENNEYIWE